jgi:anaerobic selenocysteine-containing dehydrogenase
MAIANKAVKLFVRILKAMELLGEALPNQEIFRRLARAMGYIEPELFESDSAILTTLLQKANLGEDFASLAAKGTIPVPAEPIIQFADLVFPTPSGRIEIASSRAEADGHPRVPLPHADPRPTGGRLRLLSPASPWRSNSSFTNVEKITVRIGSAVVALHPTDAAERDLSEGEHVLLANEIGSLSQYVTVSEEVPRGVTLTHKGRWPKREAAGGNVNVLNPGQKSDMGESTCVHSVEVTIAPLN